MSASIEVPTGDLAWRQLLDAACAPYRSAGRFAWHFARGKLGNDPVFRHLISRGLIAPGSRVLDIGCGQGLLTSLLLAAGRSADTQQWPAHWPAAPRGAQVTGIELMPQEVQRARTALADAAQFVCADMRDAVFPPSDTVVILDVLHYVSLAEQDRVLERVHAALLPHGRLLLRVGDTTRRGGYWASLWVDRLVGWARGRGLRPTFGRPLVAWVARLESLGFAVEPQPMSQGVPFANVLLVAERLPQQHGG